MNFNLIDLDTFFFRRTGNVDFILNTGNNDFIKESNSLNLFRYSSDRHGNLLQSHGILDIFLTRFLFDHNFYNDGD